MPKQLLVDWLQRYPPLRWGLKLGVRLLVPRQWVGAVGAVFNDAGQVLLVEHVFRTDFPWGLPGGWIKPGESPAGTVQREIEEELNLEVEIRQLLFSEPVGLVPKSTHPPHLGLAFYCRLIAGKCTPTVEILSFEWADPQHIKKELAPFQRKAIVLAKEVFDRERLAAQAGQN